MFWMKHKSGCGEAAQLNTMEMSKQSKDMLRAHAELWNKSQSYLKSVALAVALDLRIADAIRNHGGAATLSQILVGIGVSECKLRGLQRLMRVLIVTEIFTIQPPEASSDVQEPVYMLTTASSLLMSNIDGEGSVSLFPMLNKLLYPFHDSCFSMGLAAWFRHDEPLAGPCPFSLMHGETFWEMNSHDGASNTSFNIVMAAESHFLMQIFLKECGEIFHGIDSLVDVGGGVGGAAFPIASAFPSLKCSVLELPHVVAKAPSGCNVQFVPGDMFESIPPANAVFLKWIFHDWGDDECVKILKNCKQAIPSRDAGGKVIIIDIVVGSKSSDVMILETQVMCDLHMMLIGGAERDEQEWRKIFFESGFSDYSIMPVLGIHSIIILYP